MTPRLNAIKHWAIALAVAMGVVVNVSSATHQQPPSTCERALRDQSSSTSFGERALQTLQTENGDASHTRIRLNYHYLHNTKILVDFLGAALAIPTLSLDILATNGVNLEYAELITRYSHIDPSLKQRIRLHTDLKPDLYSLAPWAQDDSKPLHIAGQAPGLLVPQHYISAKALDEGESDSIPQGPEHLNRSDRYRVAAQLAAQAQGLTLHHSSFTFDGGNIVVGERHVFVGSHIVDQNVQRFDGSRQNTIDALSAEFGKPVIELGVKIKNHWSHIQADYHIDLTLAIGRSPTTGKEIVFVASEALALEALRQGAREARAAGKAATTGFYIQYTRDLESLYRENIDNIRNNYAKTLEELGYEVRRIPSINTAATTEELKQKENIRQLTVPLNYTNVTFIGGHALVPQFKVPALDRAAARVYEDAGFRVIPMPCAAQIAQGFGGPRCVVSVIRD